MRQTPLIRSGLVGLALGIGLGGITAGCGGPPRSGNPAQDEEVPEGFVQAKNAMKERAAAKKGGPGGRARAPGAH